jgi:acetylornithine deacetylase/succinyl-diaminopimelate desuccinylase-like protein
MPGSPAFVRRSLLLCVIAPVWALHAQQPTAIDWTGLRDETVQILTGYLRINTTNPPGNELQTALYLKRILDREGIPAEILDTAEMKPAGRANFYARLKGNGSKKAIALVHHMDVVPSDLRYWSVDPFSGMLKDGYVWGRGALDMKSEGIVHLMAMIALKRSGVPLNRDIVFIANSDEELDGIGAQTFVNHHADLLKDVEFLITEGGDNKFENGKLAHYGVGIAEKRRSGSTSPCTERRRRAHGRRSRTLFRVSSRVADTAVHFAEQLQPKPPLESPIDEFFHAIERAAHDRDPNALVTTPMLTGATDRPTYRALGIMTYGFDPFKVESADAQRGVHGNDERLSVENVGFGVHYLYDVLRYAQGARATP